MPTSSVVIEAHHITVAVGSKTILNDISFTVRKGHAWAIVGPSGSGKSTLMRVIAHRLPITSGSLQHHLASDDKMVMVEQQHRYKNRTDASATYYQARFESVNDDEFPEVGAIMKEHSPKTRSEADKDVEEVLALLQISHLQHTRLIQLSSGENKRFQLAKALVQHPSVLLLDNPFVGLDQATRTVLHNVINTLVTRGTTVLLITSSTEIPESTTHVMELQEGRLTQAVSRDAFTEQRPESLLPSTDSPLAPEVLASLPTTPDPSFNVAIQMRDVSVKYEGKMILDHVHWQVNRGDKWALTGPNGAGKSTLLSLINGDNPQAYANDISLFDKKKGSGESIWDVKRRIGYVSSELHLYFDRYQTCFKAVASGLTDTMVYDKRLSEDQRATVDQWLAIFRLSHRREAPLATLPLSEQRLVLLARAMVKNPPVLILDEPCQGLDRLQTHRFRATVDAVCRSFEKTLIFVSHYQEDIPECVNRMLVLKAGKAREVSFP